MPWNQVSATAGAVVTETSCVWVYAVADDAAPAFIGGPIGVGGAAVRPLGAAGLMAIVGSVAQSEFGEAALRQNLEDLDWLERTARVHHAVIETVAKERPVVPMRLATVYSSDDAVAGMLRGRSADLRQALTRLAGHSEWGVKAYVARSDDGTDGQQPETDDPLSGPGAAYLRRRRAQLTARSDARQKAVDGAQAVHAELDPLSASARLYPPQPPEIAGHSGSMVLNAAYLVADDRAEEFGAAVTELAARHGALQLTLTGPWPAYSFVGRDETEDVR
jgi:Gas vesicle synthesis protein GvpL/GvpF